MVGAAPPVDYPLAVQVLEATADLSSIENGPLLVEARVAHVVDVKLKIAAVHDGQHQAQGILGLVGVRKADLRAGAATLWGEAVIWEQSNSKKRDLEIWVGIGGSLRRRGCCKLESVWDGHHRHSLAGTAGMYTSRSRKKQPRLERLGGYNPTKLPSISLFQPVIPSTLCQLSLPSGGSATLRLKCVCSCVVVYKQDVAATVRNSICTAAKQSRRE